MHEDFILAANKAVCGLCRLFVSAFSHLLIFQLLLILLVLQGERLEEVGMDGVKKGNTMRENELQNLEFCFFYCFGKKRMCKKW